MDFIWSLTPILAILFASGYAGYPDKVLLRDVQVLTLYQGKYTAGRRSSPVPQLSCVGGTAGCSVFVPKVVQCTNRGSDGRDFQWECKTDMDNAYRFGQVSVSCEGFDYPDDPYILQGSCGLEYTIDLTKEGSEQQQQSGYNRNSGYNGNGGSSYSKNYDKSSTGGWFLIIVIILIIGAGYLFVTSTQRNATPPPPGFIPPHSGHPSGPPPGYSPPPPAYSPPSYASPPPPGFKPEHTAGGYSGYDQDSYSRNRGGQQGGGFWSGAATGGVLGYLFGSRNNANPGYGANPGFGSGSGFGSGYGQHYPNRGGSDSNWFSGGGSTAQPRRSTPSSSGTRTASGFGGTTRR